MSGARGALAAALVSAALAMAGGCREQPGDTAAASLPPPVPESEAARGLAACQDYIEKVCACARARPEDAELGELCALSGAKLSGLQMVLQVNRTTRAHDERVKTADTARRYARSCIEGISDLGPRGCPR